MATSNSASRERVPSPRHHGRQCPQPPWPASLPASRPWRRASETQAPDGAGPPTLALAQETQPNTPSSHGGLCPPQEERIIGNLVPHPLQSNQAAPPPITKHLHACSGGRRREKKDLGAPPPPIWFSVREHDKQEPSQAWDSGKDFPALSLWDPRSSAKPATPPPQIHRSCKQGAPSNLWAQTLPSRKHTNTRAAIAHRPSMAAQREYVIVHMG